MDNSYGAGLGWSGNHGGAVATPPPVQTYGHNTQHTGVFGGGK